MQAKAEALPAGADIAPEERFEQLSHCDSGDRLTGVRNPELEHTIFGFRANPHRLVGRAVGQCISDQVRYQLANPGAVAVDGLRDGEAALNAAIG